MDVILSIILFGLGLYAYGKGKDRFDELTWRIKSLEDEISRLKKTSPPTVTATRPSTEPTVAATPPPIPPIYSSTLKMEPATRFVEPAASSPKDEGFSKSPAPAPPEIPRERVVFAKPAINWEQFMGVKGFAWIGGLALFLGMAFFVKYSFDNNLIPPALRVTIGFCAGLGLLAGGMVMSRRNYPALSQTLCATGVVILYAVTFACRAFYHFGFFGPLPTFLLMTLVTAAAFFLAVRLNAMVVAILGMLGGFLTPVLLSTGQDNPLGLFGYIAILDVGLILVALRRRWHFLTALAAAGTIVMEAGWVNEFFVREKYFEGAKFLIALGVLLGFNLLYLAGNFLASRRKQTNDWLAAANLGLAAVALAFTLYFFTFDALAQRPVLLFGFVFLIDLVVTTLAWLEARFAIAQGIAGLTAFGLLAIWTSGHLTGELLNAALGLYFTFAVFHSVAPLLMQRRRGEANSAASTLSQFFPPLALALVLAPIFKLQELSFLVWPFVLMADLLAIFLAVMTMSLWPVAAVLILTLAAIGELIWKIPADLTGFPSTLMLLAGFSVFFVIAGVWVTRIFTAKARAEEPSPPIAATALPASSALFPFLLLVMAMTRLGLVNPTPVFAVALLLVALLLGVTRIFIMEWLPILGLGGAFVVECSWHFSGFNSPSPNSIAPVALLGWYLIFFAAFAVFPFLFLRVFAPKTGPWVASALAGPAQFLLIYHLTKSAWPNPVMGLLPAMFAAPEFLGLMVILKRTSSENKSRLTQCAWFGGVALLFVTLIFPIQFERQWITIGWALEGAALLWLFHRVPHPGLRWTGLALLTVVFARLALNPAVLEYHLRGGQPIFNWYLYSYGIVTAALFVGVRWLAPPHNEGLPFEARGYLGSLGTILAFLLLNIEIADYFTVPGSTLTFQFSGSFARDMSYSIGWGTFALGLLIFGIWKRVALARYAAMGLLCVTLLKLFFHDLAQLGQLYRIGAFISVAVIAMLASFAYHKFYSAGAPAAPPEPNEIKP